MTAPGPSALASFAAWFAAAPRRPRLPVVVAFAATALPAAAFTLNHFYHDGSGTDAWHLGALIWRNDLALENPRVLTDPPTSFLASHFAPLLLVPALLSHLLPVGFVAWIAAFTGVVHGSVAAALCAVLRRELGLASRRGGLLAVVLALGLGLGGMAMAALQLPHFELLIAGFGIPFLAAAARGDRPAAWLWLAAALSVREDAGLHLAAVLLVAQALHPRRDARAYVVVALAAALAAFAAKALIGESHTSVQNLYLGTPPFAHLSAELVQRRLSIVWLYRAYVWQPVLVIAAGALLMRDALPMAGVIAALPWVALHLVATHEGAGTLDLYYPFPFLIAIAWIAIAPRWEGRPARAGRARGARVAWLGATLAAGLAGMHGRFILYPWAMNLGLVDPPAVAARLDDFADRLAAALPALGTLRADYSVMGLAPRIWRRDNWLAADAVRGIDTVVWFDPGQQDSLAWASWLGSGLDRQWRVAGTHVLLASNRALDRLPALAPLLVPAGAVWDRMRPGAIAVRVAQGIRVARDAPPGVIADGPHLWWRYGLYFAHGPTLARGRYVARFAVAAAEVRDAALPVLRLEAGFAWGPTVAGRDVTAADLDGGAAAPGSAVLAVPFVVEREHEGLYLELRALHRGNAAVTLSDVVLAREDR